MSKKGFGTYLAAGLWSGLLSSAAALLLFWAFSGVWDYSVETAGSARDHLYLVPIVIASLLPSLIGGAIYYGLRRSSKPQAIFTVIVLLVAVLESVFSQVALAEEFRMVSHILHLVVALISIFAIPAFAGGKKTTTGLSM